jgi:transposase
MPSFIPPTQRIATAASASCDPVRDGSVLEKPFADGGYPGPEFRNALAKILPRPETEIVKRSDQAKGFAVLPKRWIVDGSTSSEPHCPA